MEGIVSLMTCNACIERRGVGVAEVRVRGKESVGIID